MTGPLKDFQQRVAAAVMAPLTTRWTMARRRADGTAMEREAAALVKPNAQLTAFERLEIYNVQYWLRVLGSLEEDFPGLQALVGRRRFEALARAYLADCPSTSFTLRNLGARLESWLQARPHRLGPRPEAALDMVRLEWVHIEAFDQAALALPAPGDLAGLGAASVLHLQPHLRLLHLHHAVDDLLIAVRAQVAGADVAGNSALAGRRQGGVIRAGALPREELFLAVHRHEDTVYYKRLAPEAWRILAALGAGAPLGTALEAGFTGSGLPEGDRPEFLRQAFHDWAAFGWFAEPAAARQHPGARP